MIEIRFDNLRSPAAPGAFCSGHSPADKYQTLADGKEPYRVEVLTLASMNLKVTPPSVEIAAPFA